MGNQGASGPAKPKKDRPTVAYIEKSEAPAPIPMGEYPATITATEAEDGKYGTQIKVTFDLGKVVDMNDEDRDCTLLAWCSAKLNPKSKLWEWASAAGMDLDEDAEGLDTDDLVGKRVTVGVSVYTKEDGTERNKVISVKPPRKKVAKAAKPVVKDEDEDDDGPF